MRFFNLFNMSFCLAQNVRITYAPYSIPIHGLARLWPGIFTVFECL